MQMPIKCDIAILVRDCWETAFTPANILASFSGAGIFPLDKERAIDRLSGRGEGEDGAPGYPAGLAGGDSGRSPHLRDCAEGGDGESRAGGGQGCETCGEGGGGCDQDAETEY